MELLFITVCKFILFALFLVIGIGKNRLLEEQKSNYSCINIRLLFLRGIFIQEQLFSVCPFLLLSELLYPERGMRWWCGSYVFRCNFVNSSWKDWFVLWLINNYWHVEKVKKIIKITPYGFQIQIKAVTLYPKGMILVYFF